MAFKYFLFFSTLLLAAMAAPLAQALLGELLSLAKITGTLYCTANGNMGINGAATPVFPNAQIQLQCGADKSVMASSTTSSRGDFSILMDPMISILSLLNGCNLVSNTPLTSCNVSLPTGGTLQSPLMLVGKTVQGLMSVTNIIPGGFNLVP